MQKKPIYSGEASLVVASGVAGELGIAPRHAPLLITQLKPGQVSRFVLKMEQEEHFYVSGGILEVQPHLFSQFLRTLLYAVLTLMKLKR